MGKRDPNRNFTRVDIQMTHLKMCLPSLVIKEMKYHSSPAQITETKDLCCQVCWGFGEWKRMYAHYK